jgi:class 3 adenylate cyclase
MSQEILSPLGNGFLAATTSFLLLDWIFQAKVVPGVFPDGGVSEVAGCFVLGVQPRLLIFLAAVAFIPLFTILGLVRAAVVRIDAGLPARDIVLKLAGASQTSFVLFVLLGIGLTIILARSFTQHLGAVAGALRRVQAGDLGVHIQPTSGDEVGVLADGVNALVGALREKERILQTFGRIVEPSVRDHLLSGELRLGGELRRATILFCDLRGFTSFAEHTPPHEVVAALNGFLTIMTAWVRECGGFVDKFVGDAMLVVFGLFDADPDAGVARGAAAAVRCGLGMRERITALNGRRAAAGQSPLGASVGIHTGDVLAGTIGAEDRHEYTVIGDTVNVAARLQEVAKEQGRALLVSAVTAELAQRQGVATDLMPLEPVALRGRTERVAVCAAA